MAALERAVRDWRSWRGRARREEGARRARSCSPALASRCCEGLGIPETGSAAVPVTVAAAGCRG
ncbi:MAG: hypothetical protein IT201_13490 [Thermoleophilia bacterium]|nr:hypothetical protein [Thermoleophilia bacterium]